MKLRVSHSTRYRFDAPMSGVIQAHRLTPASFEGQQVIDWSVDTDGGVVGASYRDAAGDQINTVTWRNAVDDITITVSGVVETEDSSGVLRGHKERSVPSTYLRHTRHTYPDRALRVQVDDVLQDMADASALDKAHALAAAVSRAIEYVPGETQADTTAAEAMALGKGVCQDHAHALIAMALIADLPARYVSGYLQATADGAAHEAAHAWAEIHVTGLGWVGFDPANACCPDERYVRLGSGLDAVYAAPIRGVSRGVGMENLDVTVSVDAQQQSQTQS